MSTTPGRAGGSSSAQAFTTPASVAPNVQYTPVANGQRRIYETKAQKDAEYANALQFVAALGPNLALKRISAFEQIDYTIHREGSYVESQVLAGLECKSHNNIYSDFNKYILDLKNYEKFKTFHEYGLPCYLLVGFNDGLYYWRFDPDMPVSIHAGGRTDRNDPNDTLLKVNFPITGLAPLWTLPAFH